MAYRLDIIDREVIALLDEQGCVIHQFVLNDPEFNASLMDVIASDPILMAMYNDLVFAAQVTKAGTIAQAAINDSVALRARLDELAFNEFVAKEGSTAAVLKARLH